MNAPSDFERLVLGCMDSYDSNQIVIFAAFFMTENAGECSEYLEDHGGVFSVLKK